MKIILFFQGLDGEPESVIKDLAKSSDLRIARRIDVDVRTEIGRGGVS
jgi:hypothetical protein